MLWITTYLKFIFLYTEFARKKTFKDPCLLLDLPPLKKGGEKEGG
jgi:hypothetical protein